MRRPPKQPRSTRPVPLPASDLWPLGGCRPATRSRRSGRSTRRPAERPGQPLGVAGAPVPCQAGEVPRSLAWLWPRTMRDFWVQPDVVERASEDRERNGPSLGTIRVRPAVVVALETGQSANDKPHDQQQRQYAPPGGSLGTRNPPSRSPTELAPRWPCANRTWPSCCPWWVRTKTNSKVRSLVTSDVALVGLLEGFRGR
jgi:hypothetical protein